MSRSEVDVVVVGAGLAGLACARALQSSDLTVQVLEAGDEVGGRVGTDHVDGFTLDRGFQVLNTGYPELPRVVDLDSLDLQSFEAAVGLLVDDQRIVLGNPMTRRAHLKPILSMPMGGLSGKLALGLYAAKCVLRSTDRLKTRPDVTAAEAWRQAGIPPDLVNGLLRPFFSGVLLEQEMSTSRRFTDLMMRMFARGRSTVPAGGMARLPEQIAAGLADDVVQLRTRVYEVAPDRVESAVGRIDARAVVVATDPWSAARLVPDLFEESEERGVTTVYHAAEPFETMSGMLLLDAGASSVANSIAISVAAPSYAPPGRVLISTSTVHRQPIEVDGPELRAALSRLHATDTSRWELIGSYALPRSLPAMPAPHALASPVRLESRSGVVYVAGDHRDTSSIQGALVSGRRAAHAVLADLR